MVRVRVFVNGEDYGTMSPGAAERFKQAAGRIDPNDVVTTEPAEPGAPVFLSDREREYETA